MHGKRAAKLGFSKQSTRHSQDMRIVLCCVPYLVRKKISCHARVKDSVRQVFSFSIICRQSSDSVYGNYGVGKSRGNGPVPFGISGVTEWQLPCLSVRSATEDPDRFDLTLTFSSIVMQTCRTLHTPNRTALAHADGAPGCHIQGIVSGFRSRSLDCAAMIQDK